MVNKPSSMVAGWVYHKPFMVALLVGGKSWAELNPHDFRGTKIKHPPPQRPAAQRLQCLCPALIAACDESTAGQRSNFQPLHPQLLWNSPAKNQGKKTWMKQWVNEDMGLPSPSYTCIDHVKTYTYIHIRLYITICSMHLYIYIYRHDLIFVGVLSPHFLVWEILTVNQNSQGKRPFNFQDQIRESNPLLMVKYPSIIKDCNVK